MLLSIQQKSFLMQQNTIACISMKSKQFIEFEKLEISLFSQEIVPSLISENFLK